MPFIPFIKNKAITNEKFSVLGEGSFKFDFDLPPVDYKLFSVHPDSIEEARMVIKNLLLERLINAIHGQPPGIETKQKAQKVIEQFLKELFDNGGIQY